MRKNKSALIIGAVVIVILIVLFALPRVNDPNRDLVKRWKTNGVECLLAHANANLHIHPELEIIVDGIPETIPANIGIVRNCMAEIHTHDATGVIHVESVLAVKKFSLEQFFSVWDKSIVRVGYDIKMTVDGLDNAALGELILKDKQKIILNYTKANG